MSDMLPVGVKRDGSYYTRIIWASDTETTPELWVCNIIGDDHERNGGTWGANSMGPVNLVLDFFGEDQEISKVKMFKNVGRDASILKELAKDINVYVSSDDVSKKLRKIEDDIEAIDWKLVGELTTEDTEGWQEFELEEPAKGKYVRIEMVRNHGTPPDLPWTEMNEIKLYP